MCEEDKSHNESWSGAGPWSTRAAVHVPEAALPKVSKMEKKRGGVPGGYHGDESADKAEVGEVVRVDGRGRVDLQAVIVLPSILKQTVHRVEHLMGQEEKPLSVREERTGQWDPLHSSWGSAGSDHLNARALGGQ